MSTVDIRDATTSPIDKIVFAGKEFQDTATFLYLEDGVISLRVDESNDYESVVISNDSLKNLIIALQKAINLGWCK